MAGQRFQGHCSVSPLRRLILALGLIAGLAGSARSEPLIFHASTSGQQTQDRGEGGGNPFASSLIEILQLKEVRLAGLPQMLRRLTINKSQGQQTPDVPRSVFRQDWKLVPPLAKEKRIALILVVSNYREVRCTIVAGCGARCSSHRLSSDQRGVYYGHRIGLQTN